MRYELSGQQCLGDTCDCSRTPRRGRIGVFRRIGGSSQQPGDNLVQPHTADVLHHDIVVPVVLAHAENGNDVRMVKICRRSGLAAKTP